MSRPNGGDIKRQLLTELTCIYINRNRRELDCEQSLSFPGVVRAIERRANERAVSGEPRAAGSAGAEKRKKKETAVVFLIFSICRL